MRVQSILFLFMILFHSKGYCQKIVQIDDLINRTYDYKVYRYYVDNDTMPFCGKACSFYFNNKIETEFIIEKGICIHEKYFSESGELISYFNYLPDGVTKHGEYLKCNSKGDTLQFGQYVYGMKNGRWIETENGIIEEESYETNVKKDK